MKNAKISEFMTPTPHTVGSQQTIAFARELMREHNIRHLPVLKGGLLDGIISDRDLAMISGMTDIDPDSTTVEEAMTGEPYRVKGSALLVDVVKEMEANKYGSALIATDDRVEGIFTTQDALRVLVAALS